VVVEIRNQVSKEASVPIRKVPLKAGQYYHVFNRGVNRGAIFLRQENWLFFLKRMRDFFHPEKVEVIAYCLMPNHYHLLVYLNDDDFGPKVMQPFMVSYTKAVNKQNKRVGPLFQGPFHAKLIKDDGHLLLLSQYIHLNPVRAKLVDKPEDWVYSSYQDYLGLRRGTLPKPGVILEHFSSIEDYRAFVEEGLEQYEAIKYLLEED
jgi:putative transposase